MTIKFIIFFKVTLIMVLPGNLLHKIMFLNNQTIFKDKGVLKKMNA